MSAADAGPGRTGHRMRQAHRPAPAAADQVGAVVAAVLRYLALVISAVLFLLPFYLIMRNALAKDMEITAPELDALPQDRCTGRTSPNCSTTRG